MDEASEPLSIPWWIWVALSALALLAIVIFVVKYQHHDDAIYRAHRGDSEGRSRRRRRSRRQRQRE